VKCLKKRNFALIPIVLLIIALFFYYIPFEFTHSLRENLGWILRQETEPIDVLERSIGIPSKTRIVDSDFRVEEFVSGIERPTTLGFIEKDILVLEKNSGKVKLVREGVLQENPLLDFEVATLGERGLLGITNVGNEVYLYVTIAEKDGGESMGNYIYKYIWDGDALHEQELVNQLPGHSIHHNGGAMEVDLDGKVYAIMGDQNPPLSPPETFRILQNYQNGEVDDTSVIIRVGFDGSQVKPSLSSNPFDHYLAVGIRNGFGLAVDPVTGNMWDTENGDDHFDEINHVFPGFNSGWARIMGPASDEHISKISNVEGFTYSDPEFSWEKTVAPTGLAFANSEQFRKYNDSLFVGDCNLGNLYKFRLNEERTGFVFNDYNLTDKVVNTIYLDEIPSHESMDEIIFGTNFGCITDVEFGPDGLLYVVSITNGIIYKILPNK